MAGLDEHARRAHKLRNWFHSVILLGGLALLTAIPAVMISGWSGLFIVGTTMLVLAAFAPRVPTDMIMKFFKAREVEPGGRSGLIVLTENLARRAELPSMPRVFVIPSGTINAFATGTRQAPAIAITSAMLDRLTPREVAAVLAHEVSHIRNNDLWVMGLADVLSRLTATLSFIGVSFGLANVITMVLGANEAPVPWLAIGILYIMPTLSSLLQLALSRAREYDADLEAALLTGDPEGLASALLKIERIAGHFWEDLAFPMPGRRVPQPSLLRTHPKTEDRIARLSMLAGRELERPDVLPPSALLTRVFAAPGRPRYHFPGAFF
ncbi:MAG: zinc metalloprotease HtpX [Hyphomicrobiaceae bacterium]